VETRLLACSNWNKNWTDVNPFLRAREEAQKLRRELLGDQADSPVPSRDLLSKANVEGKLNLGVKEVPRTSDILKGGKATLRRTEGWIYCRANEPWPEKAYLIGHELGHFRLDPDVDEDTVYRSADEYAPASPAAAYVEAYGARERDELQKNVFGRELLLPRPLARALFFAGRGPREIAKDLDIPLEVARQQVLDAVLLPPYVPQPPGPLPAPSSDQQLAIDAKEKHVHVVAGPGTGKTTTLVHRVKKLIERDGVDPRKILVLTFSNKAAAELVDRLQRAGVKGASEIWAGTFHAFGLEFLRKYYQHFGVAQDVSVADKITQVTMTSRALGGTHLEYYRRTDDPYEWLPPVLDMVLRVKEELVSIDDYLARALAVAEDDEQRAKYRDVAAVAGAYDAALLDSGMVDFVDLVAQPALAIGGDRARFTDVADRYQHVLVDEFQDLTSAMLALTSELTANANLWVVGDVRQAIYHWRGASFESLLDFEGRFASAKRYDLVMNRRSVKEVIDVTVAAGRNHPLEPKIKLPEPKCSRGSSGNVPELVRASGRSVMWAELAAAVRGNLKGGIPLREQVAIAYKGAMVSSAARELKAAGIPVVYVGELLERPEVKDILAVIQLVVEKSPRALLRVANLATPAMKSADLRRVIEAVSLDGSLQRGAWLKSASAQLSAEGQASRQDLARKLKGMTWSASPWDFVCEVLLERRFLIADIHDDSIDGHLRRLAQWQFAYMSRVGDGDGRRPTLFRLMHRLRLRQQLREVYIDRSLPPETNGLEGVRVMTLHASKGLEFQSVHLVGINGKHFAGASDANPLLPPEAINSTPKRFAHESDVEAHNLLYVAVSRAKDTLTIYDDFKEFLRTDTAALEAAVAGGALRSRYGTLSTAVAPTPLLAAALKGRRAASNEEFLAYDRCPRQFLYRFGLEMGQELSPNPSLQARGLVKRTLKVLARSGAFDLVVETFEREWEASRLPNPDDDPQLWAQALSAAQKGAIHLARVGGEFFEAAVQVKGVAVSLPWGVVVPDVGGSRLHCVDFYSNPGWYRDRQDKILGQLMELTSTTTNRLAGASLFDVTLGTSRQVAPQYVGDLSVISTVASGLASGKYPLATSDYPCARCAYSYVCPSLPPT
jgi:superfamily I DNA/RNA helicase/Zn-dependent peptidase ImmA (M78 family)